MDKFSKYAWISTLVILLAGFLCLYFEIVMYGITFFMLFPCAVGFAIGTHDEDKQLPYSQVFFGLFIFFIVLLGTRLEGLVCVIMAIPPFVLAVYIGYKVRNKFFPKKPDDSQNLMLAITPLLILLLLDPIERMMLSEPETVSIETSILLDYPPDVVFKAVKSMDKLDADKPIGLILGLPAPYQCVLDADTIGAKRTCFFDNGQIVAEITQYEMGKILEMKVIEYSLLGRHWFHFVDATYTFKQIDNKTSITRTSSYQSVLQPRFYWQPLETWGIEQEHLFVLNSLKKNLKENSVIRNK